ncbi:DNA-directed RNA polymeras-like protein III subunit Rpc34 [Sporormia fimetaria CBS 119925]|uniref:DNA-directed RNA polymerase III subunit RPC6 n=1 Tax=Sporormia fimetaria CBS 119925 TaxID=1340428 RepID=A0A6A6VF90_9PLEO|nr:DNA-directed RNA polymeras-like protein III subunit Rpc34 [Sporormia fimetaria CBS 119925]
MLYNKCESLPKGTVFFQRDLTKLAIAEDSNELLTILQDLVERQLMKLMTFDGEACWKLRPREEAEKLRKLTPDERLLYTFIDSAKTEGIWTKALRARTNFTAQRLNKGLKSLESKDLVQSVMSVKHPSRKMYLLAHLTPSEEIAGGPWQSEGEFDTALIEIVSRLVEQAIQKDTCVTVPPNYNPYTHTDPATTGSKRRRTSTSIPDIEDTHTLTVQQPPSSKRHKPALVLSAEPKPSTATTLLDAIVSMRVVKDKTIRESDMEQLLDMMVLENRIEKVGNAYRLVMKPKEERDEGLNGFVDAPCGTCPVFDVCGNRGEITARTCVYYGEWAGTESEVVK